MRVLTDLTMPDLTRVAECIGMAAAAPTPEQSLGELARRLPEIVDAHAATAALYATPRSATTQRTRSKAEQPAAATMCVASREHGWPDEADVNRWRETMVDAPPQCPFFHELRERLQRSPGDDARPSRTDRSAEISAQGSADGRAAGPMGGSPEGEARNQQAQSTAPGDAWASARAGLLLHDRRDLVRDEDWYAHPHVRDVRRPLGIDHCLYAAVPTGSGSFVVIAVHRPLEAAAFTARDRQRLEVITRALVPAMLRWMPHRGLVLPEHLRRVHRYLVDTDFTEVQIAEKLGLKHTTIREYTKRICGLAEARSRLGLALISRGMDLPSR